MIKNNRVLLNENIIFISRNDILIDKYACVLREEVEAIKKSALVAYPSNLFC